MRKPPQFRSRENKFWKYTDNFLKPYGAQCSLSRIVSKGF